MTVDSTVIREYELEANQVLQEKLCELPRGQKAGSARVVEVRDALGELRQKLLQQLQAVNMHLHTCDKLDERHQVRALLPTQQYPAVDVAAIVAGTDKKAVIKTGQLPENIVTLISQWMTDREMEYAGRALVDYTALNANLEVVQRDRRQGAELILNAVKDIVAGKPPALNLVVKGVHTLEGLSKLLRSATAAQLDAIVTFLIESCPDLSSLDFEETEALSLGVIYKLSRLQNLESLRFKSCNLNDEMVYAIATSIASLRQLELLGCKHVTAAAFTALDQNGVATAAHMKQLTSLKCKYTPSLNDADVLVIVREMPELSTLYLQSQDRLTDQSVTHIAQHAKNLKRLDLSFCGREFTDAAFTAPDAAGVTNAERLKGLIELDLTCCDQMTDRALHAIATQMTQLTSLGCPIVRDISSNTVAALVRNGAALAVLKLSSCWVAPGDLQILVSQLPKLTHLDLTELRSDRNKAIAVIAPHVSRLTHFHMDCCTDLTDTPFVVKDREGMTVIERMKNLISLNLSNSKIGDATALEILKHLKQLMHLKLIQYMSDHKISPAVRQQLQLHYPFVQLDINGRYEEE